MQKSSVQRHFTRFISMLLGLFFLVQPVVGFADPLPNRAIIDRSSCAKKALFSRQTNARKLGSTSKRFAAALASAQFEINNSGCCGCFTILPTDFGEESSQTFVIATPGKYTLQQDVVFLPTNEYTPAIVILSDNVTLDLCSHTLSQGNTTPNAYGVQIGEGYFYNDPDAVFKNIEVRNGNIVDFTAIGVFCYNGSFDGPTAQLPFEDLRFSSLNILDCGPDTTTESLDFASGINLDSSATIESGIISPLDLVAFANVVLEDCNVNRAIGHAALQVYTFDNLIIKNTNANNLVTYLNQVGYGCFNYGANGRNLQMFNCQGNGARNLDPVPGGSVGAALISTSLNVYIKDCQFNDAYGEADYIVASQLNNNENAVFENCQFNNYRAGSLALQAAGVHISQSIPINGRVNRFINCQSNGHSVSEGNLGGTELSSLVGFYAQTTNDISFEHCQACNIITTNPNYRSVGFLVFTQACRNVLPNGPNQNVTISNCIASDITGGTDTAGIWTPVSNLNNNGFQGTQTNVVIQNCISERIRSLAEDGDYTVAGIAENLSPLLPVPFNNYVPTYYDRMVNLQIKGCRVSDVRSGFGPVASKRSAGILLESVQNPVISDNSISDCERGILFSGTCEIIPNAFQLALTYEDATANPPIPVDIGSPQALLQVQSFYNKTRKQKVDILMPEGLDAQHDLIYPVTENLTQLHWCSGDKVGYDSKGGVTIPGLVNDQIYYAIVYRPGYTVRGLVQNNNVTNCSISGYQDNKRPTNSAWINNFAMLNGTKPTHSKNFKITWPNKKPQVDKGTLGEYPKNPNKNFNTSLIFAK